MNRRPIPDGDELASLGLTAQEVAAPWTDDTPIRTLLAVMLENPWAPLRDMSFGSSLKWDPFVEGDVIHRLSGAITDSVGFRSDERHLVEASIARNPHQNTARFELFPEVYRDSDGAAVRQTLARMIECLPSFTRAWSSADEDVSFFYAREGLDPIPDCFGEFVLWLHVISPRGYEPFYDRETLLAAPAHEVTEDGRGNIWIISYPDPYGFADSGVPERIVELNHYWQRHAKR